MSKINPTKPAGTPADHTNFMGGSSWNVSNPLDRLRMAAASCFFGEPVYYGGREGKMTSVRYGGASPSDYKHLADMLGRLDPPEWHDLSATDRMVQAIDEAIEFDLEGALQIAVALRQSDNIRTTPQVIMVRAANHPSSKGTGLVRTYGYDIIRRGDEPSVQLAYQLAAFGKPIPNQLKKAWADYLSRQNDYTLGKYTAQSRVVKTVDVVNVSHPTGASVNRLVTGTLPTPDTWETRLSAEGSTPEAWAKAFGSMGHMALLRNLRNLITKSSVPQRDIAARLVAGVAEGQQLPFRYWSAYQAIKDHSPESILLEGIEMCLRESCRGLMYPGRVMSLCDNSGSAWGALTSEWGTVRVAEIANLTAILTAMGSEHGEVGVFGDNLATLTISKFQSIFDLVEQTNRLAKGVGQRTENGVWLFWDRAIKAKTHYDAVFVYSDMQAGHGGLYGTDPNEYRDYLWDNDRYGRGRYLDVAKLINTYRSQVNPNVEVFLVQVAGYQDTLVPEHYNRTHILGGWSEGILRYAQKVLTPQQ